MKWSTEKQDCGASLDSELDDVKAIVRLPMHHSVS